MGEVDRPAIARSARISRQEQRLVDGFELIEQRREAGLDVSKLEAFWLQVLHEYEALLEGDIELEITPEIQRLKEIRRCQGCGAQILWRITPQGRNMPLNAETTAEEGQGVYILEGETDCKPYDPLFTGVTADRHMSHWGTCPNAARFKNRKSRPME